MSTRYKYEAYSPRGAVQTGTIVASDSQQVEQFLADQNLMPIEIKEIKDHFLHGSLGFLGTGEYEQLIMFTNALSTMYKAGVPLLRALSIIQVGKAKSKFNKIIAKLGTEVQAGKPLSEAMKSYPNIFSRVYIASVAAGEESGQFDQTLDEMAEMLEREMEITRQVKQATRYPTIVLIVISLAFLVMMTYVVPRFVDFYSSFDATLPLPTRILIATSNFITSHWIAGLALLAAGVLVFRRIVSTEAGRLWFDRSLLKQPIIGNLVVKGNVARFAIMFSILIRAGIPLVKSLEILAGTVKNSQIAMEIRLLQDLMRKGQDINQVKNQFHFFPNLALHMMAIGMESGSLDILMQQVGAHFTKETMYRSRQLTSVLEPVLTLVLGVFVLVLALAIFLPMWSLIKVFQG